jgi:N-acyl-D-amino-acid deacylase
MLDLVIRDAMVVDGTGAPARRADVGVADGRVAAVGEVPGPTRRTIDAEGLALLPGWVDVHTHYDGQATWDAELAPSSWHGVTTAVFGNCSVGFAPVRPGAEGFLINLMEGVEDIPGSALAEGIDFSWESFPEYLDALDAKPRALDVGAQVPHAALRFYVMGDRGADHAEAATPDEVARMGELAVEAVSAGAFGFTTSRTRKHRAADGRFTPSLTAADAELLGIAGALGAAGIGTLQINSDFGDPAEIGLLRRLVEASGRPLSFSLLQVDERPDEWRTLLDEVERARADGYVMFAQVGARPIGVLFGLTASVHPLLLHPAYVEVAELPLAERVAALVEPQRRQRLVHERPEGGFADWMDRALTKTFELGDPPDYEPDPARSVTARAAEAGRDPYDLLIDLLVADGGRALLYYPFENYAGGDLGVVARMLASPHTIAGLSDGGAHVATICDASFPTTLITHWTRDRTRGPRFALEQMVHKQTGATAAALGLGDRGIIAPGYRADLNVVDLDALRLSPPELVHDLPAGGKRLVQRVEGYRHTFCAGVETFTDGEWTGATPGALVRGPQPAPTV